MPFQSEKQRKFMWANHPEIAQRWADEEKSGQWDGRLKQLQENTSKPDAKKKRKKKD